MCDCMPIDVCSLFDVTDIFGDPDTFNWRDVVMLVGLAASVAGVAIAAITGATLTGVGFLVTGIVTIFATSYVRQYPNLLSLKELSEDFGLKNFVYGTLNEKLETNLEQFEEDITSLETQVTTQAEQLVARETQIAQQGELITQHEENNAKQEAQLMARAILLEEQKEQLDNIKSLVGDMDKLEPAHRELLEKYSEALDKRKEEQDKLAELRESYATIAGRQETALARQEDLDRQLAEREARVKALDEQCMASVTKVNAALVQMAGMIATGQATGENVQETLGMFQQLIVQASQGLRTAGGMAQSAFSMTSLVDPIGA